jgi:hypothetical protein
MRNKQAPLCLLPILSNDPTSHVFRIFSKDINGREKELGENSPHFPHWFQGALQPFTN